LTSTTWCTWGRANRAARRIEEDRQRVGTSSASTNFPLSGSHELSKSLWHHKHTSMSQLQR
jgi:hypothetical protein